MVCMVQEKKDGEVKQGKEAVMVWKNHFEKILNTGVPSEGEREATEQNKQSNTSLLDEDITRQEVVWALGRLKSNAAPGKDGLTAEMVDKDILVEFWYELFKLCWKKGTMASIWKQTVVISVPNKRSMGPCVTGDFCGISLVSTLQGNAYDCEGKTCPCSGGKETGCRRARGL